MILIITIFVWIGSGLLSGILLDKRVPQNTTGKDLIVYGLLGPILVLIGFWIMFTEGLEKLNQKNEEDNDI